MAFSTGVTQSSCTFASDNNAQYLLTIDKNSIIGSNSLQSVSANFTTTSTSGTILGDFLYFENVIEFMSLTSNTVSFTLDSLPAHQNLIIRARVYTDCDLSSQSQTVNLILNGQTTINQTKTLTQFTEDIIEGEAVHNDTTFTFSI